MKTGKWHTRRVVWMLVASVPALLLMGGLVLALSGVRVWAQPAARARAAALEVHKSVSPTWTRPGGTLSYTIHIANTGDQYLETVWLTDPLPAEVTYAGGLSATTGAPGTASNVVTWTGALSPSAAVSITFAVQVTPSHISAARYTFTNTAQVTGAGALQQAAIQATAVVTFESYLPFIAHHYPLVPVLDDIPAPSLEGSYTVSWSPVTGTDRYVLEEATDAGFVHVTRSFTTTTPSQFVQEGGAYGYLLYYRVRADDDDGWGQGLWSNVKSVSLIYFDDFSDPNSGWPITETEVITQTHSYYRLRYENGQYRIMIDQGGPYIWRYHPDALAPYRPPTDKYCVEVSMKVERGQPPYEAWNFYPYWANGGIVFGADEQNTNIYAMCLSVGALPDGTNQMGWFIMRNPVYQFPRVGCSYGKIGGEDWGLAIDEWHRLDISVDGDLASVYIDRTYKGTWEMWGLHITTRVGVIGGDYEVTPVDFRFDNFRVMPGTDCRSFVP